MPENRVQKKNIYNKGVSAENLYAVRETAAAKSDRDVRLRCKTEGGPGESPGRAGVQGACAGTRPLPRKRILNN